MWQRSGNKTKIPRISLSRGVQSFMPLSRGLRESLHTISSLIQTILSVLESHQINCLRRSRTIPPVGNFAPPRRTILICSLTEYHNSGDTAIIFYQSTKMSVRMSRCHTAAEFCHLAHCHKLVASLREFRDQCLRCDRTLLIEIMHQNDISVLHLT